MVQIVLTHTLESSESTTSWCKPDLVNSNSFKRGSSESLFLCINSSMNIINSSFQNQLSSYRNNNRQGVVWLTTEGAYACRFYENQVWQRDEVYAGRSESYAEEAAENYVFNIENV